MMWTGTIKAGTVCREVAATIDIMPTLAKLCDGNLPTRKIDGHDIWPLMSSQPGAKSPHEAYVLDHKLGAVRSGKWKFYPWPESKAKGRGEKVGEPSPDPVQLYDTVSDIGERKNVAAKHPEIVTRLHVAYDRHVADLAANSRPVANLIRPTGAKSPQRPGGVKKRRAKKKKK
jgi:arylsulfatase A